MKRMLVLVGLLVAALPAAGGEAGACGVIMDHRTVWLGGPTDGYDGLPVQLDSGDIFRCMPVPWDVFAQYRWTPDPAGEGAFSDLPVMHHRHRHEYHFRPDIIYSARRSVSVWNHRRARLRISVFAHFVGTELIAFKMSWSGKPYPGQVVPFRMWDLGDVTSVTIE